MGFYQEKLHCFYEMYDLASSPLIACEQNKTCYVYRAAGGLPRCGDITVDGEFIWVIFSMMTA